MSIYIARQPIFDKNMNVFAYELLYRDFNDRKNVSQSDMTEEVTINTLVNLGVDTIIDDKKAFINFTKNTVNGGLPYVFPNDILVVEILESVVPDSNFIDECNKLKSNNYILAIDDYEITYPYEEILDLVDIVKVDFSNTTTFERKAIIEKFKNKNVKLLAEKVETQEEYNESITEGYDYFQGFFFAEPTILKGENITTMNNTYIMVLSEANKEDTSFEKLEEIVKRDVAVTYNVLKLVNSPLFYSSRKISSIKEALVRIGLKEIKKWFSLMMIRDIGSNSPKEIIRISLIRAKMMENMLLRTEYKNQASIGFLVGIFSLIDVILKNKMEDILNNLPLEDNVKNALSGDGSYLSQLLNVISFYERGEIGTLDDIIENYGFDIMDASEDYLDAINWVNKIVIV